MADPPTRIVVVEDADEVRELLVLLLEAEGYAVTACEDAEQAFLVVTRERPSLVLTDLMLGAGSGLDLITRIRSNLAPPVPPIVVCSGFTGFEGEAQQRGAAAFIPKPFEPSTIRATVRAILTSRDLQDAERAKAQAETRALRARAVEAATAAIARLEPRRAELVERAGFTTEFLARYYGCGEAFAAVLQGDALEVMGSSNEQVWRIGQMIDLPLCRDILETSSALVVPNLESFGAVMQGPDGKPLRFFAGVPLSNGPITVGVLCLVDEQPQRLGSDAFSVLDAMGDRGSAVLSDQEWESAPFWTMSGLLTRDGLNTLLAAELSRMERETLSLALFVFTGRAPAGRARERSAFAAIEEKRFAALFTRDSDAEARRAVLEFLGSTARDDELGAGGLIGIEGGPETLFDARGITRAAEGLLERALRSGRGAIERVVIRREPLSVGAAAVAGDRT